MLYEDNLKKLKQRDAALYETITDENFEYDREAVHISTAKNGEKIVTYTKDNETIHLNSTYNPQKEAVKYMEELFDLPEKALLVMFGLSNGDFLRAFLNHAQNNDIRCIVYEPSAAVFMQVLANIDITDLLGDDRVCWIVSGVNEQSLTWYYRMLLSNYNIKTNKFIVLPKYAMLFQDKCKNFVELSTDAYDRMKINQNTGVLNGKRICKNSILNISHLHGARSEMDFAGRFPEDLTAIIVSAGPSLEKNVDCLKNAKGKALIIVVDTAIPVVLKHDILPDMIICIDMEKPLKYFEDERLKLIPFLVAASTNYEVLDYVQSNHLIFMDITSLLWANLFAAAGGMLCIRDMGGSVATAAISLLIDWKFKRVILVGQDLALTDNREHAGEDTYIRDYDDASYKYIDDIYGNQVLTRLDFYNYIMWIEEMAYRFPEFEIIDATEGGALKKKTTIMTLKDAIKQYCTIDFDFKAVLEDVPRLFVDHAYALVGESLHKVNSEMQELCKLAELCMKQCNAAYEALGKNIIDTAALRRTNDYISEFNQRFCDFEGNDFITESMQFAQNEVAGDLYVGEKDDVKEAMRMYEKSVKYFEAVAEVIPQIRQDVEACISRIEESVK